MQKEITLIVAVVAVLVFLVFLLFFLSLLRLWIQCLLTNTHISIMDLIGMKLRRTPPELIVRTAIMLTQRGVQVRATEIESCYLASGGAVTNPIQLATLVVEQRNESRAEPQPARQDQV
jgi:uncharacterized protein YqfA (UPF0365 family)